MAHKKFLTARRVDDQAHKYKYTYLQYQTLYISIVKDDFEELYHKLIMRWSSAIRLIVYQVCSKDMII